MENTVQETTVEKTVKVRTSITMSPKLLDEAKTRAVREGKSVSAVIEAALSQFVNS